MQNSNEDNTQTETSVKTRLFSWAKFFFSEAVELVGFVKNVLDLLVGNQTEKTAAKNQFKENWLKIFKNVGLIMLIVGTNPIVLFALFIGYKILEAFERDLCESEKSKKIVVWIKYVGVPVAVFTLGVHNFLLATVGVIFLGFYNLMSSDFIIKKLVKFNGGRIFGINIKQQLSNGLDKIREGLGEEPKNKKEKLEAQPKSKLDDMTKQQFNRIR